MWNVRAPRSQPIFKADSRSGSSFSEGNAMVRSVLRGAVAGNRIEVADHEIGVDAEGTGVVEAAVRGDDEGVIRNRRGLIVIIACAEDHAGAGIVEIHTR